MKKDREGSVSRGDYLIALGGFLSLTVIAI